MKKIRMIKENDLFDWKVGDEFAVKKMVASVKYGDSIYGGGGDLYMREEMLVDLGYAEFVEDKPKEIEKINEVSISCIANQLDLAEKLNEIIEAVNKLIEDKE